MIAQLYSVAKLICHDQVQISHLFELNMLGVQCAYKHGSVAILIVPTLVLFPPSNHTRMLAYSEINPVIPEINALFKKCDFCESS